MAKSQTNQATGAANTLINQANAQLPPVVSGLQSDRAVSQGEAGQTFGQALSGYTQQQTTGGFDPTQLANLRSEFAGMVPSGGYDPTQLANLRTSLAGMAPSGGYDPAQLAQTLSGYGTMADTGGFSAMDRQNYLNQATSGSTSLASNLAAAAQRSAAASGGSAGSSLADIQRTAGSQAADATTGALTGLNQQINANKLAGLGGLAGTEQSLAAARQGISGQQASLESGVAGGSRAIAGLQSGLESGVAGGVQAANQGISNLFNTATGQVTALGQQVLQGLGLQYGTEAQGSQILQELSKNPGLFQTIVGDIGTIGGAAAGVMKGIKGTP